MQGVWVKCIFWQFVKAPLGEEGRIVLWFLFQPSSDIRLTLCVGYVYTWRLEVLSQGTMSSVAC